MSREQVVRGASLCAAGLPEEISAIPELLEIVDVVPLYLYSVIEGSATFADLTFQLFGFRCFFLAV